MALLELKPSQCIDQVGSSDKQVVLFYKLLNIYMIYFILSFHKKWSYITCKCMLVYLWLHREAISTFMVKIPF
jgi:hypothetical protein